MSPSPQPASPPNAAPNQLPGGLGMIEFVALMAMLISLTAVAIDIMLPALPQIAEAYGFQSTTHAQWVLAIYLMGFALGQFVMGSLVDRFGRRGPLLAGLAVYTLGSLLVLVAPDHTWMLLGRLVQGIACAAPRVAAQATVRDCFTGRQMARVMSLVMMAFILVPVVAPAVGQGLMLISSWQAIFVALCLFGIGMALWVYIRLPETLAPERQRPLKVGNVMGAIGDFLSRRICVGYTLCMGCAFGGLLGYVNSSQQIFVEVYDVEALYPVLFGIVALAMASASFVNSVLVERLGMRLLSHGMMAAMVATTLVLASLALAGSMNLWVFVLGQMLIFFQIGMIGPNVTALAMEPVGHIAGSAAAFMGGLSTLLASVLGVIIGQLFDGSVVPLLAGFFVFSLMGFALMAWAEQGRLFTPANRAA